MTPQPNKKLTVILLLLVFLAGMTAVAVLEMQEVEAKKVVKKTEPLKTIKLNGKYAPKKFRMNSTHIEITGWYCTCGKYSWGRKGTIVLEKKVRFTKNNKVIPMGKNYRLAISPKLSFNKCGGELTVKNKGTRYDDIDLCFCGREKSQNGKSVNQYYMKRLA